MAQPRISFTEEIAEELCERLSEGESMRHICRDSHLPNRRTVLRWMAERPDFASNIARAREGQADCLHDDMADIEAEIRSGALDPQAARIIIWSKQWRASKLAPKKYGDKASMEVTGKDGGPIETRELSQLELARRIGFVFAKAEREMGESNNG